jgi:uncharacterized protein YcfJ
MKSPICKCAAASLGFAILLPSCDNPALTTAIGAGAGAVIGHQIGGDRGALIGGLVGAGIGYAIGKANEEQKRQAEMRAAAELRKPRVRQQVSASKAKYVAVPVKKAPDQKGPPTQLMKVNVATGKPTGDIYAPPSSVKSGQEVKLGGETAVYYGDSINEV